jgi:hypothetical protein
VVSVMSNHEGMVNDWEAKRSPLDLDLPLIQSSIKPQLREEWSGNDYSSGKVAFFDGRALNPDALPAILKREW